MSNVEAERQVTRINVAEAVKQITMCFKTKRVPMLVGPPGIGKTAIIYQIAKMFKLYPIVIPLSQYDPIDIGGMVDNSGPRAKYKPFDIFPLEGDPVPKGYTGWLIFFDEFNTVPQAVQAVAYRVLLEGYVGQFKINQKAVMAGAGNLMTDAAIVNKLSTANQSRLIHYELVVDPILWSLHASSMKWSTEVISYINHKPQHLHKFDPNHNEKTFPCPRTWEFTSDFMLYPGMTRKEKFPSLVGAIGEGMAHEFDLYCDVYKHIPTYADIKRDPKHIHVPLEPIERVALSGIIGSHLTIPDISQVMQFIYRIPFEFQVFALRDAIRRIPIIRKEKEIMDWLTHHADALV